MPLSATIVYLPHIPRLSFAASFSVVAKTHGKIPQIAIIHTNNLGPRSQCAIQLGFVVHFHQRRQMQLRRQFAETP